MEVPELGKEGHSYKKFSCNSFKWKFMKVFLIDKPLFPNNKLEVH